MPQRSHATVVRLAALGVVGGLATLTYAGTAWTLSAFLGWPVALASPVAYGVSAFCSYHGHARLTFRDRIAGPVAVWRFTALSVAGYGAAAIVPALVSGPLGGSAAAAILATCVAIPALNYVVLDRLVFARTVRAADTAPRPSPSAG